MSFTDQLPRIATEQDVALRWSGCTGNFRCGYCGHKIAVGERWRWVFTNDIPDAPGNPLCCGSCLTQAELATDGSQAQVTERLRNAWGEMTRAWWGMVRAPTWWWFLRQLQIQHEQETDR